MRCTARCCRCATAPTTRIRSTNGPRSAAVPSPEKRVSATKARKPIVLTFPAALDRDVTTALRAAGFRFNKVMPALGRSRASRRSRDARQSAWRHARGGRLPTTPPHSRRSQQKPLNDRARDLRLVRPRATHRHPALALVAVLVRLDVSPARSGAKSSSPSPTGPPRPTPSRIAAGRPSPCSARSC